MMSRTNALLAIAVVAASALIAAPAAAIPGVSAAAPLQTGGTVTTTAPPSARPRCSNCSTKAEQREIQAKLFQRLDSLRWEFENRRMTDEERHQVEREFVATLRTLQRTLNEQRSIETEAAVARSATTQGQAQAGAVATGQAGFAYSMQRRPNPTRGYIGVTFEGVTEEYRTPTDHSVRFFRYPRVALVEPSSPAERAGVMRGDTVVSLNGTDIVSEVVSFTKLLVPDARLTMTVRRDGNSKEFRVTVAEAQPDYYVYRRETPSAARIVAVPGQSTRTPGGSERVSVYGVPQPSQAGGGVAARAPGMVWIDMDGLGGAEVVTVTEGLRRSLKLERGVLITRAVPGTPAHRSGLQEGDVIVKAASYDVQNVSALRRILSMGDGEEGVKLVIVREGKQRDVTLRWER